MTVGYFYFILLLLLFFVWWPALLRFARHHVRTKTVRWSLLVFVSFISWKRKRTFTVAYILCPNLHTHSTREIFWFICHFFFPLILLTYSLSIYYNNNNNNNRKRGNVKHLRVWSSYLTQKRTRTGIIFKYYVIYTNISRLLTVYSIPEIK